MTVTLLFLSCVGCAPAVTTRRAQGPVTRGLLYDARPGWPAVAAMTGRSTWPSAPTYSSSGEHILFVERFIDIQRAGGVGQRAHDHVYRRFSSVRVGRGHR